MKYAILLAGGVGSRLASISGGTPKPLMSVGGMPFIKYILNNLIDFGFTHIVICASYKWQELYKCLGDSFKGASLLWSIEKEPAGTGGAIKEALYKFNIEESFVLNADTIFNIDLHALEKFHDKNLADISVALRYVLEADRFGSVVLNKHSRIIHFGEKNITGASLINGGVYIVKASSFVAYNDKAIFSFENDFIKHELEDLKVYGCQFKNYFIDIGIPDDFKRAELDVENFKFYL